MWILSLLFTYCLASDDCKNQCQPTKEDPVIACVMRDCTFNYTSAKNYTVSAVMDIRIINSNILCLADPDLITDKCIINLEANSIYIVNSTIYASEILILASSTFTLDQRSKLTTQGAGYSRGKGYSSKGGSYGGLGGGTCLISKFTYSYGNYRIPTEKGSGGYSDSTIKSSAGGGAIYVDSTVFNLYGSLNADGNSPSADPFSIMGGGSGGSIFVKADRMVSGDYSRISANGGYGNSYGGGGGRIAIYSDVPALYVSAFGGTATDHTSACIDAAPGTIYEQYGTIKKLIIANNKVHTQNVTPVQGFEDLDLSLKDGGLLIPTGSKLSAKSITLDNSYIAPINLENTGVSYLNITTGSFSIINGGHIGVLGFYASNPIKYISTIRIEIKYLYIDFLSGITINDHLIIHGNLNESRVLMAGSIEGFKNKRNSKISIYVGSLKIPNEGTIFCTIIGIYTNTLTIQGSIQTLQNSCLNAKYIDHNPQYTCIHKTTYMDHLDQNELADLMNTYNFTVFLQGEESIDLENGSRIRGGRIGICSRLLNITGIVSAEASGCVSNTGIGRGNYKAGLCKGGGGGYGGHGGVGDTIPYVRVEDCYICMGTTYGKSGEPSYYEGSGGGVYEGIGAAGGGYIQVESFNLRLDGILNSDGEHAPNGNQFEGAGGGSGGSILVRTRYLSGMGYVHANGNNGTEGGGDGGGGRVYLDWIENIGSTEIAKNCSFDWNGTLEARSPPRSSARNLYDPKDGTVSSKHCMPGYGEIYCRPCEVGYYKKDEGNHKCYKCSNKPEKAYYTDLAEADSDCSYECHSSYTSKTYNPDCISPMQEFFYSFGSIWITCMVFSGTWALLFILNSIFIVERSIKSKKKKKYSEFAVLDEDLSLGNEMLMLKSPNVKSSNPELTITDMPYHYHRIYLVGNNTYFSPWFLPDIPPAFLESEIDIGDYTRFAEKVNKTTEWKLWEFVVYLVLIFIPPFYILWEKYRRKVKYNKLKDLIAISTEDFWMRIELRQMSNSLRLYTTDCYAHVSLDVLNISYRKNSIFPINNPIKIMAKGDGSLLYPFKLEDCDPMLTYIKYSIRKEYLPMFEIFYQEMNALFRLFEFRSAIPNKDENYMKEIVDLCKMYEMMLFNENELSVTPVIFQAPHFSRFSIVKIKPEIIGMEVEESIYSRVRVYEYRPGLIITQHKKQLPVRVILGTSYWSVNPLDEAGKELLIRSGVHCVDNPRNAATKWWYPFSCFLIFRVRWELYVISILGSFLISLESVMFI